MYGHHAIVLEVLHGTIPVYDLNILCVFVVFRLSREFFTHIVDVTIADKTLYI